MPPPTNIHPGNDYYVNPISGTIQRQSNPLLAGGLSASGWLGPYNWATAKAQVAGLKAGIGAATVPGMPVVGPGQGLTGGLGTGISNLGGINAIGDFFNRLTQPNTWIRVGEVAAGLLLLYLGLSATMRGTEAQRQFTKVKSTGKKIAAVAAK